MIMSIRPQLEAGTAVTKTAVAYRAARLLEPGHLAMWYVQKPPSPVTTFAHARPAGCGLYDGHIDIILAAAQLSHGCTQRLNTPSCTGIHCRPPFIIASKRASERPECDSTTAWGDLRVRFCCGSQSASHSVLVGRVSVSLSQHWIHQRVHHCSCRTG